MPRNEDHYVGREQAEVKHAVLEAYSKLEKHLKKNTNSAIESHSIHGDFTEHVSEIVDWTQGHFTFFFVDPKGWKQVITVDTLSPLLTLKKSEFLINLMYDFVNRFVGVNSLKDQVESVFGSSPDFIGTETPEQRQKILLDMYQRYINGVFDGKATFVPVEKPGQNKVLYFLVYLTRHAIGVAKFKTAAEKMVKYQRVKQSERKLRAQQSKSPIDDLFGDDAPEIDMKNIKDNRSAAREYLLSHLSTSSTLIDHECWANYLIDSELYPTDFQIAMKELNKEGLVKNITNDVSMRRTQVIKPNWPNKSEKWQLT